MADTSPKFTRAGKIRVPDSVAARMVRTTREDMDAIRYAAWNDCPHGHADVRNCKTCSPCIHPGVFATGPVTGPAEHCWTCDTDVPRELL